MKLGIDARMYGPRVGGGGIGRYVEELVKRLARRSDGIRYVLFVKPEARDLIPKAAHFEVREADIHWYGAAEQLRMPALIDNEKLDLVHVPHWNVAMLMKTPFVATIHDLILLEEPRSARATTLPAALYTLKYLAYRAVLRQAVVKSRGIIAPSQAVKDSILFHFSTTDNAKIQVINEGVTELPAPAGNLPASLAGHPYFLCVGNSYPHKNLGMVLNAFAAFFPFHPETRLVFAGRRDTFRMSLEADVAKLGLPEDAVVFIDSPSDTELSLLYANTTLYLFPSRIEGFGLPPLEALAAGAPVAVSDIPVHREILGGAVKYFSPNDPKAIAKIMSESLTRSVTPTIDPRLPTAYSWDKMTEETVALYKKLA